MNTILEPARILLPGFGDAVSVDCEDAFFSAIHQSNGTTRMTSSGRLVDVDSAIADLLPGGNHLDVLDVGISSGISTIEWLQSLEGNGRTCAMIAFDRVVFARLYRFGPLQVLAEEGGHVLLIHNGRRAITRPAHRTGSWNNRVARTAFWLGDAGARLAKAIGAGDRVSLISRRLQARSDVRVVEHDIFSPAPDWNGRFDVVRVANLLNRSYFSEPQLRAGLRHVGGWVQPGGLLVVARSEASGRNNATLFRREAAGLRVIHRLGSGSEVEALVTPDAP